MVMLTIQSSAQPLRSAHSARCTLPRKNVRNLSRALAGIASLLTGKPVAAGGCLLAALVVLFGASNASAQTVWYWNGAGNDWGTAGDWTLLGGSTHQVPGANDIAQFYLNTNRDPRLAANFTVGELRFLSNPDPENFTTTNGSVLTLNGVGGIGIDNTVNKTDTFSVGLALGSSQTWQATNSSGGGMTITGGVNLGAYTLTINPQNAANTFTINSTISGTGSVVKNGAGLLVLGGTNTYGGTTTLNGGTVQIAADAALGTAPAAPSAGELVFNGGTLATTTSFTLNANRGVTLNSGDGTINTATGTTLSYGGIIAGVGDLAKSGAGTLVLSGASSFTGNTTVSAGTLSISSDANLGAAPGGASTGKLVLSGALQTTASFALNANRGITLTGTGSINPSAGTTLTYGGIIAGSGNLLMAGAGTLTLSGANTYAGTTTISGGTLRISADNNLGAAPVGASPGELVLGGTLQTAASFALNSNRGISLSGTGALSPDAGTTLTYGGIIAGTGNLQMTGAGTLTLSGANTYSGTTTLAGGTLRIGSDALGNGSATNTLIFNGGTLNTTGNITLAATRGITLTSTGILDTNSGTTLTYAGVISGAGDLVKNGAGTLVLGGAANTYGDTTINAGTVRLTAANVMPSTGSVTIASGATFDLNNNSNAIGALAGVSGSAVTLGSATLTTGGNNADATYAGTISGTGALVKTGTGAQTLSGTNTYSGATSINGGTLVIGADANLGAGPAAPAANMLNFNGGTLETTASFTLNSNRGATLNAGGGSFNPDAGTTLTYGGIVAGTGGLTKAGNGTLVLSGTNTYSGATTLADGSLQISADSNLGAAPGAVTTNKLVFSGGTLATTGTFTINANRGATLNAGGGAIDTASGTTLTYGGILAGAAGNDLIKSGAGTLVLSGANTYIGNTTIAAGTVLVTNSASLGALGSTVSISNGGTLDLGGAATQNTINFGTTQFTIAGTGVGGAGAIVNSSALMQTGALQKLTLAADATVGGSGRFDLRNNAPVLDLAGNTLTKSGAGQFSIVAGSITDGNIIVNGGTFAIQTSTSALAGNGSITVNNGATLGLWANTGTVTRAIVLNGGSTLFAESGTATIGSAITLGSGTVAFTGNITTPSNLTLTGPVSGAGGFDKTQNGTVTLTSANSYTGTTTVSAGVLNVQNDSALGSTAAGTTVAANAALQLQGGVSIGNEALTLNGTGVAADGALRSISGTNSYAGPVTLGSDARINSDAGDLTLSGAVSGSGLNLTVGGAGNTTLAGTLNTGAGLLTKDGAGTLILSGTDTYGATTISAGTLQIGAGGTTGNLGTGAVSNAGTLAFNRADTVTVNNVISGAGGLTQAGSGTTILSGANSYTGTTTITSGTLQLGASSRIADTSAVTFNGGTLALNGFSERVGNVAIATNSVLDYGTSVGGNAFIFTTITSAPGVLTISNYQNGTDFLGTTTAAIPSTLLDQLYFVGIGSGATEAASTTSAWLGTAAYTLTAKTIAWNNWISNSNANWSNGPNWSLGASPNAATAYASFGTGTQTAVVLDTARTITGLRFDTTAASYSISGGNILTMSGGNATSVAFIQQKSANNQTLSPATINLQRDMVVDISGAGNLTIGAAVTGATDITVESSGGKLILSGNSNTYTGNIAINSGVVQITNAGALGTTAGTTRIANGAALEINGGAGIATAENITFTGVGIGGTGVIRSLAGNNTLSGTLTVASSGQVNTDANTLTVSGSVAGSGGAITFGGSGNTTVSGTITSGISNVTKVDAGTLTLSGNNAQTGTTAVNGGTVIAQNAGALGSGPTTVASGAALGLAGNIVTTSGDLTLVGTGVANSGALYSASGANTFAGNITITGDTTIGATAGNALTLSGGVSLATSAAPSALVFNPAGNITVNGIITDLGATNRINVSHTGTGTVTLANANSYAGNTTVGSAGNATQGTLLLTANNALPARKLNSDLTIFSGTLGLVGNVSETAFGSASYTAAGNTTSNLSLVMGGGGAGSSATIDLGTGNLTVNHDILYDGSTGAKGATIKGTTGTLTMGGTSPVNTHNITVTHSAAVTNSGATDYDLAITAAITDTGATTPSGLQKYGNGTLMLSGNNSYHDVTSIQQGVVNIQSNNALGGNVSVGATVSSGATLQLSNAAGSNLTVGTALTIAGNGVAGNGALENLAGNNAWTGGISVNNASARIQADSGTNLTISGGGITGAANGTLEVGGGGNTIIASSINNTIGGIVKNGAGTLTLSGGNSFGNRTVSVGNGTLSIQNNAALGITGANNTVNVAANATVAFDNTATGNLAIPGSNNLTFNLNGVGTNGAGALQNTAGTNTVQGQFVLQSNATISANAGTALTLGGNITASSASTLTVGTGSQNGSVTIGAINSGAGAATLNLVKAGTVSGADGRLTITGGGSIGTVSLNAGAMTITSNTLTTGAFTTTSGTSLLIATNNSPTLATLNLTGNSSFALNSIDATSTGIIQMNGNSSLSLASNTALNLTLRVGGTVAGSPTVVYLLGNVSIGTLEITGDTILDFGNSAVTSLTSSTLKITNSTASIQVRNWATTSTLAASDLWKVTGAINGQNLSPGTNDTAAPLTQVTWNSPVGSVGNTTTWVGDTSQGWYDHEIRPTPEPATYGAIFISACLGLVGWRRYRRHASAANRA
jgi:fibronectin-binding autotransporter adhesin